MGINHVDPKDIETLSQSFASLIPLNGKKPFENDWSRWCLEPRPFIPADFRGHNAGIPCGPSNGIIVLDVDHVEKFNKLLKVRDWKLTQTRVHLTGSGKPHYIYQYPSNGHTYGCRSVNDPEGEKDPQTGNVIKVFDVKGLGGQVVSPGSIHPGTGRKYTVHNDLPIAPAPEWLLDLCRQNGNGQKTQPQQAETSTSTTDLEALQLSYPIKKLIREGEAKGKRSEAIMSVLNALVRSRLDDRAIIGIFEAHPAGIGQKYFEAGNTREKWLLEQVKKVRNTEIPSQQRSPKRDIAVTVKTYCLVPRYFPVIISG